MNLLDLFRFNRTKTAETAKERLQIVVSHQRAQGTTPDYILKLREELMGVIAKYTQVEQDKIQVQVLKEETCSILELNVTLPIA